VSSVIAVNHKRNGSAIAVREKSLSVVAVKAGVSKRVIVAGLRGPAGRSGTNGGETFQFEQEDPSAVWTVPHNLQRRPSVMVTDLAGDAVISDIRYIDDNIIQIMHGRPVAGFAYCN
jgi:hypothetical protein